MESNETKEKEAKEELFDTSKLRWTLGVKSTMFFKSGLIAFFCFLGVVMGVMLTFTVNQQTATDTWMCYQRGGVIRIPVATVKDSYNKSKPIWALYTTFREKQYYLWETGIEKDGPSLYRRYSKPVYILDQKMLNKLRTQMIEVSVEDAVRDKSPRPPMIATQKKKTKK